MARYGIDYYGLGTYSGSAAATASYSAGTFLAKPYNYGAIQLTWSTPTAAAGTSIASLVIVRNQYGFPVNPYDGTQVLVSSDNTNPTSFIDSTGLSDGGYFYYSLFIYVYTASTNSYAWVNAGTAYGFAVTKAGYTDRLYGSIPDIYKILDPSSATADWSNQDLYNFLANFGFQLDYMQNSIDLLRRRYNIEKVNGNLVPTLMNQFGFTYEGALGLQQNRILLRDAITLNKQKGSKQGLTAFLKDFTGYAIPTASTAPNPNVTGVTLGHNLMLDYNDSSAEEGTGHWVSSDGTSDMDWLGTLNVTSVSLTSNVATLVVGPHQYDVGNYITVTGLPATLFNQSVPQVITSIDQTNSISFALSYASNVTSTSGYNLVTNTYGQIHPSPIPWSEPTAPSLFPNKTGGILALYNMSATAQAISAYCGDSDAIGQGIPVTAGTVYSFNFYVANGGTARAVTPVIKWYDRFGKYISSTSGTAITDTGTLFSSSYRPVVNGVAPTYATAQAISTSLTQAYYAVPGLSIASVGGSATNEHHYIDAAQFEASPSTTVAGLTVPITAASGNGTKVTYTAVNTFVAGDTVNITGMLTSSFNFTAAVITSATGTQFTIASTLATGVGTVTGSAVAVFAGSTFDEARQLHIVLKANRINELINPHFASPLTPWTVTNASSVVINNIEEPTSPEFAVSTTGIAGGVATVTLSSYHTFTVGQSVFLTGISGSGVTPSSFNGTQTVASVTNNTFTFNTGAPSQATTTTTGFVYTAGNTLEITATAPSVTVSSWDGATASQLMPIYYPGTSYSFSVYAQSPSTAENVQAVIQWYNSSKVLIGSSLGVSTALSIGNWVRPYVTDTAPTTAAYAVVQLLWSTTTGHFIAIDEALFENNGLVLPYFDGSNGQGLLPYDFMWEGNVTNGARSHFYKNRYSVQTRLLGTTITNQINAGSTVAFYLAQPQT